MGFIIMYFLIRNIRDELNIKNELVWVILTWFIASLIYFTSNATS